MRIRVSERDVACLSGLPQSIHHSFVLPRPSAASGQRSDGRPNTVLIFIRILITLNKAVDLKFFQGPLRIQTTGSFTCCVGPCPRFGFLLGPPSPPAQPAHQTPLPTRPPWALPILAHTPPDSLGPGTRSISVDEWRAHCRARRRPNEPARRLRPRPMRSKARSANNAAARHPDRSQRMARARQEHHVKTAIRCGITAPKQKRGRFRPLDIADPALRVVPHEQGENQKRQPAGGKGEKTFSADR